MHDEDGLDEAALGQVVGGSGSVAVGKKLDTEHAPVFDSQSHDAQGSAGDGGHAPVKGDNHFQVKMGALPSFDMMTPIGYQDGHMGSQHADPTKHHHEETEKNVIHGHAETQIWSSEANAYINIPKHDVSWNVHGNTTTFVDPAVVKEVAPGEFKGFGSEKDYEKWEHKHEKAEEKAHEHGVPAPGQIVMTVTPISSDDDHKHDHKHGNDVGKG